MIKKILRADIDFDKVANVDVSAVQGETGTYLDLDLFIESEPFDVSDADEISVMFKRPDGFISYLSTDERVTERDYEEGQIRVWLTNQILSKPGTVNAEIIIKEGESEIKSWRFDLRVLESVGTSEIESTNEVSVFQQLVDDAVDAAEDGLIDRVKEEITDDLESQLAQTALETQAIFETLAKEGDDWEVSE